MHPNLEPHRSSGPRPWTMRTLDEDRQQRDRSRTPAAKRAAIERRINRQTKRERFA